MSNGKGDHGFSSGFRAVQKETDPLLNLGFKRNKSAPIPNKQETVVVHNEETKATKSQQKQWQIPAAVSNWKNSKGFMIDLDKRLKTSQEQTDETDNINTGFAALNAALAKAETTAKNELRAKASQKEEMKRKEEEDKKARLDRMVNEITTNDKLPTRKSRDERRAERRRKAAEEISRHTDLSTTDKLRQLAKDQNRDISDRIIVGASNALKNASANAEDTYDSSLFLNSAKTGTRINGELYDKPLFAAQDALNDIYKSRNTHKVNNFDDEENEGHGEAVEFVKDDDDEQKIKRLIDEESHVSYKKQKTE
ncbi:mRNA splicing protein [Martiniozyma asiatica (nom. inval.)]|nr:mRNA splicing protein [Martiniozyma asiatica]